MRNNVPAVLDKVDFLLLQLKHLRSRGPHFRILHRFRIPGTECLSGEEVAGVYVVHRGREFVVPLSVTLRLVFDFLAKHTRLPQSASQIEAAFRADPFYTRHGANATRDRALRRRITRSAVKVYVQRIRGALSAAFHEASLPMDPRAVLLSQATAMNEVGYRLRGTFQWIHIDHPEQKWAWTKQLRPNEYE
jgi:hypothetical protein